MRSISAIRGFWISDHAFSLWKLRAIYVVRRNKAIYGSESIHAQSQLFGPWYYPKHFYSAFQNSLHVTPAWIAQMLRTETPARWKGEQRLDTFDPVGERQHIPSCRGHIHTSGWGKQNRWRPSHSVHVSSKKLESSVFPSLLDVLDSRVYGA